MKRVLLLCTGLVAISFLLPHFPLAQTTPIDVSFGNIRARSIGPAVMSGRVSSVAGVDSRPEILYVGAAGGGLWKSVSAGADFRPVFDEHTQSIGDICVDPQHPDTVWVGTGEPWVRNSVSVGTGIYVSTNGGQSWQFKGLGDSEHIAKVLVDPTHSATIYVAAQGHLWGPNEERGVYKSTDFGQTWQRVLFVDENTGCADLTMHPENPRILIAAMWDHRRSPDFFRSGGPGSGLYKTEDGGQTWRKVHQGLPEGLLGRMAVEFAPSNPQRVYLTVESENKEAKGLYRSDDGGESWYFVSNDFNTKVRPFYFSRLVVDPTDENKIFKCGLNLTISDDGGESWRVVGSGVHSDIHDVWVNPRNPKHIVIGTDGGAYRSLDGGYLFEMFFDLPISQFYHVAVDNAEPFNVYGGLQDNGSWYGPSASPGGIGNEDWKLSYWGDGFWSFPHPTDPDIVYSESQGGMLARHNKADGQSKSIQPIPGEGEPKYRFNWNAPIHISPNNPERLYFGAQFLFKSENRGDSWEKISPDLTTNDPQRQRQKESGGLSIDNSGAENNTTIYAIAESPVDEQVIWVGTDDGNLQVTTDGGRSWTNVAPNVPGLPPFTWCSSVEPSHFDRNTCYVTFDGHRQGDKSVYVFKTTDLGKTWTSLATPDIEGYCHVVKEDLESPRLLYVGTEFGLFISLDGGLSWKRFANNLPKVAVRDLAIHPRDKALVIATHGRGIYIIDDLTPLRAITPDILDQTLAFLPTKPTYIRLPRQGRPFGGAGNFNGENPSEAVQIAYFMKRRHTFGRMRLEVYDAEGNFVNEFSAGKSAGINIVELPTRLPQPKAAPTNNRMALFGSAFPPSLPEGRYTVKIIKGKEEFSTEVEIGLEPKARETYPKADRDLAHKILMRLYDMTERLGYVYFSLEAMHQQAEERAASVQAPLAEELKAFADETKSYKEGLVSLEGDFYVDEGENLREEISTLYLWISNYPGRPTDGQLRKTDLLEQRLGKVEQRFEDYRKTMERLNEQLQSAGLQPIAIKSFEAYRAD